MKKISTLLILFLSITAGIYAQAPKKVVLEDYTGAWCGYCPRGLSVSNQVEASKPYVIALGVHGGSGADAMKTPYSLAISNAIATGFPTGGVDRVKFAGQPAVAVSTNTWNNYCFTRYNAAAPLNVFISSTYNASTRVVDVTVTANFVAAASGDMRLSCLLVEDSVIGTGSGYDQHNYYGPGCGATDPNSPWYPFPCTIPGYSHRHVVRTQLANSNFGETGIIPAAVSQGQDFTKSFTYTLPPTWDDTKMEIVAFVSHYGATAADSSIMNANKTGLGGTVQAISTPANGIATITGLEPNYPNPFSDYTNISFTLSGSDHVSLKVYDLLGKEITTIIDQKLSGGEYNMGWDGTNNAGGLASEGLYFYKLTCGSQVFTRQMTLIRD